MENTPKEKNRFNAVGQAILWLAGGLFGLIIIGSVAEEVLYPGTFQRNVEGGEASELRHVQEAQQAATSAAVPDETLARITVAFVPCDEAWSRMQEVGSRVSNRQEAYQVASAAARICDYSWRSIHDLRDLASSIDLDTIESCEILANERRIASKAVAEMVDDGLRPSKVEAARLDVLDAEAAAPACRSQLPPLTSLGD